MKLLVGKVYVRLFKPAENMSLIYGIRQFVSNRINTILGTPVILF